MRNVFPPPSGNHTWKPEHAWLHCDYGCDLPCDHPFPPDSYLAWKQGVRAATPWWRRRRLRFSGTKPYVIRGTMRP